VANATQGAKTQGRHFHRHVNGLSLYYHSSLRREGLDRHAHEPVQLSIPLRQSRRPDLVACDEVDVIPGFEEHATSWGGAKEVVILHFDQSFFRDAIEAPAAIAERHAKTAEPDPFVANVGLGIRRELLGHDTIDDFHLASLGTLLAGYLFLRGGIAGIDSRPAPRMTYEQSRRAIEMMQVTGEHSMSLLDISSEVGLSQWHFSRQFRRTTGLSPYQFLLRSRVERARDLLRKGHAISEVAAITGFTDQSHMHRHFKRILGVTPGSFRAR
jgi:AraC family transcriptional regulator